jgi:hypothetical protein
VVNAWVDFNNDGDWDEPNEQIFTDEALASGNHNLTFAVPDTAVSDVTTSARFRCSTVTGLNATDVAPDGEVEDYQVDIAAAFDYGDLPDAPYGTLAPGGAHHLLNGIWLGATVDAEGTGFPSTGANGDDANSGDDEDGILFDAGTWGDGTGEVEATVSGGSGCLIGWVDFEGLNGFGDNVNDSLGLVSEHIFTAFLTPGTTTVSFDTPASTTGLGNYVYPATLNMRFRFFPANDPLFTSASLALDGNGCPAASNSTPAMDAISVGAASNGEVEDYVQSFSPTAITLQSFGITSPFAMWSLITIILASLALITIILLQGRAIERQRKAITRRPSR